MTTFDLLRDTFTKSLPDLLPTFLVCSIAFVTLLVKHRPLSLTGLCGFAALVVALLGSPPVRALVSHAMDGDAPRLVMWIMYMLCSSVTALGFSLIVIATYENRTSCPMPLPEFPTVPPPLPNECTAPQWRPSSHSLVLGATLGVAALLFAALCVLEPQVPVLPEIGSAWFWGAPSLLASVAACGIALAKWRQARRPSFWLLLGFGLMLVHRHVGGIAQAKLDAWRAADPAQAWAGPAFRQASFAVFAVWTLFLLFAILADRRQSVGQPNSASPTL